MDAHSTNKMLNICCIGGTERVGCLTMLVMAKKCSNICITIVDEDVELIKKRSKGEFSFYEPGVTDLFQEVYNLQPPRLIFSSNVVESLTNADIIFIAIDINLNKNFVESEEGWEVLDLEEWLNAWKYLKSIPGGIMDKIIVELSSVPLEFEAHLRCIFGDLSQYNIVFNGSFMSQGTSIHDLEKPSQVLIASVKADASNAVRDLYAQWVDEDKISVGDSIASVILGKLSVNACLGMQINSVNEVSSKCTENGADIDTVLNIMANGCGMGKDYLKPGVGFGGPNLERDLTYLASTAELGGLHEASIIFNKIIKDNEKTRKRFVEKMVYNMGGTHGKKIAVLGVAYKKDTDSITNSPAIEICKELVKEEGAEVMIYDPQAKIDCIRSCFKGAREKVKVLTDPYEACVGAHAICILTDWTEFSNLDFVRIFNSMQDKGYAHVFFGRRMEMLLPQLVDLGFKVHDI